jgi:hypothetical protein
MDEVEADNEWWRRGVTYKTSVVDRSTNEEHSRKRSKFEKYFL